MEKGTAQDLMAEFLQTVSYLKLKELKPLGKEMSEKICLELMNTILPALVRDVTTPVMINIMRIS